MFWEIVSIISLVIGHFILFGFLIRYIIEYVRKGIIPSNMEFAVFAGIINSILLEELFDSRTIKVIILIVLFIIDISFAQKMKDWYDTDEYNQ